MVVEDDPGLQNQLKWSFEQFNVKIAGDAETALAMLRRFEPAVVTLDLGLPPDPGGITQGFLVLEQILALAPNTKVIVITGNDDRDNAVRAIGVGAYDFYPKPIDPDILAIIVNRALHLHQLEIENKKPSVNKDNSPLQGLIAVSPEMTAVCQTIEKIAPADVTTLLLGESGTGKEVLVRALHQLSSRADKPFVAINCAAIPESLLESELFGYEKGAFSGAVRSTAGKIERANNGTFFLDEIGDLPLPLQAKLLRFLQERIIERIGGQKEIPIDVRVVCATHRDLLTLIDEGVFREDLYYRLNEVTVTIPPLRERTGDAIVIANALLERFGKEQGKAVCSFSQDAIQAITEYSWPGNVRELENRIKRAVIMSETGRINATTLEIEGSTVVETLPLNLRVVRENAEKQAIKQAFKYVNGNVSKAAESLGVTRPTLYALLKKYNLKY